MERLADKEQTLAFWGELLGSGPEGAGRAAEKGASFDRLAFLGSFWSGPGWEEAKSEVFGMAVRRWPDWLDPRRPEAYKAALQAAGSARHMLAEATMAFFAEALKGERGGLARLSQSAGGIEALFDAWGALWGDGKSSRARAAQIALEMRPERGVEKLDELRGLLAASGGWGEWHRRLGVAFSDHRFLRAGSPSAEDEADFFRRREPFLEPILRGASGEQARGGEAAESFASSLAAGISVRFSRFEREAGPRPSEIRADAWAAERFWAPGGAFERLAGAGEYRGPLGRLARAASEEIGEPKGERAALAAAFLMARGELREGAELAAGKGLDARQSREVLSAAIAGDKLKGLGVEEGEAEPGLLDAFVELAKSAASALAGPAQAPLAEAKGGWRALWERALIENEAGMGAGQAAGEPSKGPRL